MDSNKVTLNLAEAANAVSMGSVRKQPVANGLGLQEMGMGAGAMGASPSSPSSSPSPMNRGGMGAGMPMGRTPMNYGTQKSSQNVPSWRQVDKENKDRKYQQYGNPFYDEDKVRPPGYVDDEDVWPLDLDKPTQQEVQDYYDNLPIPPDYYQLRPDGQTVVNPKYNAGYLDKDYGMRFMNNNPI